MFETPLMFVSNTNLPSSFKPIIACTEAGANVLSVSGATGNVSFIIVPTLVLNSASTAPAVINIGALSPLTPLIPETVIGVAPLSAFGKVNVSAVKPPVTVVAPFKAITFLSFVASYSALKITFSSAPVSGLATFKAFVSTSAAVIVCDGSLF